MKKYLNTPEEVIKALKEGKEVKVRSDKSYKLVDGFVVCFVTGVNNYWIVDQNICKLDKPYIEEAEPLKFEVGKFYKNRNEHKVICALNNGKYPVFGNQDTNYTYTTYLNGRYHSTEEDGLDIISEWED